MVRLSAFAVSAGPNSAVLKVVMLVTAGRSVGNEATHLMLRPNSCRSLTVVSPVSTRGHSSEPGF